jgi:hypothetical protein
MRTRRQGNRPDQSAPLDELKARVPTKLGAPQFALTFPPPCHPYGVWQWRQQEARLPGDSVARCWRLATFLGGLMHLSTILWLAGGIVVGVVAVITAVRRGRPDDLGSVSNYLDDRTQRRL